MRNANAIKPELVGYRLSLFSLCVSGRGVEWFLPVDEVEVRVEVVGIAHQLRTHFIHVFLGVLVGEAQYASEEGERVRLDDLQECHFTHATDLF